VVATVGVDERTDLAVSPPTNELDAPGEVEIEVDAVPDPESTEDA
jgi:hypothetical protein